MVPEVTAVSLRFRLNARTEIALRTAAIGDPIQLRGAGAFHFS